MFVRVVLIKILLLVVCFSSYGNMANPLRKGTVSSSAFGTADIDILSENITVEIDSVFSSAIFNVTYEVHSKKGGESLLLAFVAQDYLGDFEVYSGNEKVDTIAMNADSLLAFSEAKRAFGEIYLRFGKHDSYRLLRENLKFFRIPIQSDIQKINVRYRAKPWNDNRAFIKHVSFRYSLFPVKFWRNFTNLTIKVKSPINIDVNFGEGKKDGAYAVWHFENLPGDYLIIAKKEEPSLIARFLLFLGPLGIGVIFYFALIIFHCYLIRKWIIEGKGILNLDPYLFRIALLALFFDFIAYLACVLSYPLIDFFLGDLAHGSHGVMHLIGLAIFVAFIYIFRLIFVTIYANIIARRFSRKK